MFFRKLLAGLFRKKSFAAQHNQSSELKRVLGPFQLVTMGIGAIVGAGIFVVTGAAASTAAGPAVVLSFALAGLCCIASGLCYGELSTMIPCSGGAYTYNYVIFGEVVAWLMGSLAVIGYMLVVSLVSNGWSGYFVSSLQAFGFEPDLTICRTMGEKIVLLDGECRQALFNLPATSLIVLVMVVLYFGIELSVLINTVIVVVKMAVLGAFIAIGIFHVDLDNWIPFIPENTGRWGHFGISGVISGASLVFTAFNGYDSVAAAALETKNPQKNLPIGIIGALLASTVTYMLVAAVLTGLVSYQDLNVSQPIALAVGKMAMPWFAVVIKVGAVIGLSSVVLIMIYSVVRMLFAMIEDGLLPKFLGVCHKRYKTPHLLTVLVSLVVTLIANFFPLAALVQLSNVCLITMTISVCLATIYARYKYPEVKREFRCPGVPYVPLLGIVMLIQLLITIPDKGIYCYFFGLVLFLFITYLVFIAPRRRQQQG